MSNLNELYQEVILDHNKNPRYFKKLENYNRKIEARNPLCGDQYTIYLLIEDGKIKNIGFEGVGCAISKASSSLMTSSVVNQSIEFSKNLFNKMHLIFTGKSNSINEDELGSLFALSGVSEFPARVKCASLSWHALNGVLSEIHETVTTE
ncbi:MAG: SUF system NifU family Fe-S cluster assembly protein [Bacteroidetes bacterium]|nr:SUF system NifU family Fe-S cluster assembly protein [Bacteroidota bacterium]